MTPGDEGIVVPQPCSFRTFPLRSPMRGESCFFLGCRRPNFIPRQLSSPGLASPHLLRFSHLCSNQPPATGRCAKHFLRACVTVIGEAERVTHAVNWRNAMFQLGISPTPST